MNKKTDIEVKDTHQSNSEIDRKNTVEEPQLIIEEPQLTVEKPQQGANEAQVGSKEPQAETANNEQQQEAGKANVKAHNELGGPKGLEPTRYGDWESKGRCYDF